MAASEYWVESREQNYEKWRVAKFDNLKDAGRKFRDVLIEVRESIRKIQANMNYSYEVEVRTIRVVKGLVMEVLDYQKLTN